MHERLDQMAVQMSQRRRRLHGACMLLLSAICASASTAAAAAGYGSPQGDSWDSIKYLPDWSGTFALDRAGHEAAGKESLGEGHLDDGGLVPLTPKYAKLRIEAATSGVQPNLAKCLPAGVPGVMLHTLLTEFLFTPGRVTILIEDGEVRRVATNRRTHVSLDQLSRSYEGDSIGHWEGKTLVVDTAGFPNGTLFQNGALLVTRNTHYVERMFLRDHDHLQIDSVISDPDIFTRPYAATRVYERQQDTPMTEPQCAQTTRDHDGVIDLTPPPE